MENYGTVAATSITVKALTHLGCKWCGADHTVSSLFGFNVFIPHVNGRYVKNCGRGRGSSSNFLLAVLDLICMHMMYFLDLVPEGLLTFWYPVSSSCTSKQVKYNDTFSEEEKKRAEQYSLA